MPYVTSVERLGMQKGFEQGHEAGQLAEARAMVLEALEAHFQAVPADLTAEVQRVESRDVLHALLRQAITCPTLEAFREVLSTAHG